MTMYPLELQICIYNYIQLFTAIYDICYNYTIYIWSVGVSSAAFKWFILFPNVQPGSSNTFWPGKESKSSQLCGDLSVQMCALINLIRATSRPWMSGWFIYYSYTAARTWVELTHQFDSKGFVTRAWMTLTFHGFSAKIGARVVPHGAAGVWISVFKAKKYNHAVVASSWGFVWYRALPEVFVQMFENSIPIGTGLMWEVRHCPGECLGAPAITTCSPWGRGCRVLGSLQVVS